MDLRLHNVSKSFAGVKALVDVDFEADFGEVRALLGENGAGKSTFVKVLNGSLKPDSGEIYINDRKLNIKNPDDAIKEGIGTVYQELSLVPNLSVAHNIFLHNNDVTFGKMISKKLIERRAGELLRKYKVDDVKPSDLVKNLGLPHRQMIEIVKMLSKNPKVVILDEATSALTEEKVKWLLWVARSLADEEKLVIFISHRMAEIKEGCDNVTVFRNGRNVGRRVLKDTDSDELVAMMLGRKMTGYYPERRNDTQEEVVMETRNLSIRDALDNVNLSLHKGEVMGVGGLAGQGQSALFRVLAGVVAPSSGEILIEGEAKKFKSPADSIACGITLIPEDRGIQGLVTQLSIRQNITLPVLNKVKKLGVFIDNKKENIIIDKSMSRLQIKAEDADVEVMTLSGGNQQKVVFAKMFATEPKILLLYDCTRGVDVGTKTEIYNLVKTLSKDGHVLLYYSTDVEELVMLCDKVSVMHDGKVIEVLEDEDITKENIILASVGEKISRPA